MSIEFVEIEGELPNREYRHIGRRRRKGRLVHRLRAGPVGSIGTYPRHRPDLHRDLSEPSHRLRPKGRSISSDRRLRRIARASDTSIQRDEHLAEPSRNVSKVYRHGKPLSCPSWRRPTFQTSPHRQLLSMSGCFVVVVTLIGPPCRCFGEGWGQDGHGTQESFETTIISWIVGALRPQYSASMVGSSRVGSSHALCRL